MALLYRLALDIEGEFDMWSFHFVPPSDRFLGEVDDYASGYAWLLGDIGGPVVWVGGSGKDPEYASSAQRIEVKSRHTLRSVFSRDRWLIPEPIKDSMGWSFAMYSKRGDDSWHDATGQDASCGRYRFLEVASALSDSEDAATEWVIEQFEAPVRSRAAIRKLLEGKSLAATDVKNLAIRCSQADVRKQLKELRYGESFVRR